MDEQIQRSSYNFINPRSSHQPRPSQSAGSPPRQRSYTNEHFAPTSLEHPDDLSGQHSAQDITGGYHGHRETWIDFLRDDFGDAQNTFTTPPELHSRDTGSPSRGLATHMRPGRLSVDGSEVRKRRLTSSESSARKGGHAPSSSGTGHGRLPRQSFHAASTDGASFETSSRDTRPIIDLTGTSPPPRFERPTPVTGSGPHVGAGTDVFPQSGSDMVLPPWQPDHEVSRCPVCDSQFSFWHRKHHCRKCGRVVCATCSPHRITIPRQFIVHPPSPTSGYPTNLIDPGDNSEGEGDGIPHSYENPALGGGEEVRVCNPCVPDPNLSPPPTMQPSANPAGTTGFPDFWDNEPIFQPAQQPSTPSTDGPTRNHSVALPRSLARPQHRNSHSMSAGGHGIMNGLGRPGMSTFQQWRHQQPVSASDFQPSSLPQPPTRYHAISNHAQHPRQRLSIPQQFPRDPNAQYHYLLHTNGPLPPSPRRPNPQSTSLTPNTDLHNPSVPPRPRIAEEDECPICQCELPSKGPDGDETAREAHVMECIACSFVPSGATPRASTQEGQMPARTESPASEALLGSLPNSLDRASPLSLHRTSSTASTSQPRPRRPTGNRMLVYRATEKDCVGEDGDVQECVICFEEFEEGDEMSRLECLCKFHKACIRKWWDTKGQGSCPTHQLHD